MIAMVNQVWPYLTFIVLLTFHGSNTARRMLALRRAMLENPHPTRMPYTLGGPVWALATVVATLASFGVMIASIILHFGSDQMEQYPMLLGCLGFVAMVCLHIAYLRLEAKYRDKARRQIAT